MNFVCHNIFNLGMNIFDIIGPIMIGPSSSHTAGACRCGRVAWKILGEKVVNAEIELSGSFAQTYRGHGTDKAIVAGILGYHSWDDRIRNSLEIAKDEGLEVKFTPTAISGAHPNTASISLVGENGAKCCVTASSIGGGNILVTDINGLAVSFTGQYNTLLILHKDEAGAIAAVTSFMAYAKINIGNFRLTRPERGGEAVMTIEVDGEVSDDIIDLLGKIPNVIKVILVKRI